jgi:hypothetical protein
MKQLAALTVAAVCGFCSYSDFRAGNRGIGFIGALIALANVWVAIT